MSGSLVIAGLLLGLDSLLVSIPLGALDLPAARRRRLALAFGLCDGLATGAGASLRPSAFGALGADSTWIGPALIAGYGLYVLALGWRAGAAVSRGRSGRLAYALPVLLSLDNLVGGASGFAGPIETAVAAVTMGALSGGMSLLGMAVGAAAIKRVSVRPDQIAGGLWLLAAAVMYSIESLC